MDIEKKEIKKLYMELYNFLENNDYEIKSYKEKKIYGACCLYWFIEYNDIDCYKEFLMIYQEFDLKNINEMFMCYNTLSNLKRNNMSVSKKVKVKKLKERK